MADQRLATEIGGIRRVDAPLFSLYRKTDGPTARNAGTVGTGYGSWPETERIGWGGRDRTSECWNQNPVPYHLATPQQVAGAVPRRGPV